jgi:hypothetical protein
MVILLFLFTTDDEKSAGVPAGVRAAFKITVRGGLPHQNRWNPQRGFCSRCNKYRPRGGSNVMQITLGALSPD